MKETLIGFIGIRSLYHEPKIYKIWRLQKKTMKLLTWIDKGSGTLLFLNNSFRRNVRLETVKEVSCFALVIN